MSPERLMSSRPSKTSETLAAQTFYRELKRELDEKLPTGKRVSKKVQLKMRLAKRLTNSKQEVSE